MLKYASTMVAAVTLGMVTAFAQPVNAQTTEKPLVLKGQSTHPASSNFHLIFKLWAETVEKMKRRVEYDLDYLRNWSLALDVDILLRTARLVWRDGNAY